MKENTTYLGRKLEVKDNEIVFGVDGKYVDHILTESGMSDLKGFTDLKWEKPELDEPELDGWVRLSSEVSLASSCGSTVRTRGRRSRS